jgi:hypothetical protein
MVTLQPEQDIIAPSIAELSENVDLKSVKLTFPSKRKIPPSSLIPHYLNVLSEI